MLYKEACHFFFANTKSSEEYRTRIHGLISIIYRCCMSLLLFSLYINGAVKKLKEGKCGIEYGNEIFPGLLFADDTCLVASDAPDLMKNMDVLVEWCREWRVIINVAKSGIMHIRNRKVGRCDMTLAMGDITFQIFNIIILSQYISIQLNILILKETQPHFNCM